MSVAAGHRHRRPGEFAASSGNFRRGNRRPRVYEHERAIPPREVCPQRRVKPRPRASRLHARTRAQGAHLRFRAWQGQLRRGGEEAGRLPP
jgi:hypothetical protein